MGMKIIEEFWDDGCLRRGLVVFDAPDDETHDRFLPSKSAHWETSRPTPWRAFRKERDGRHSGEDQNSSLPARAAPARERSRGGREAT